MIYDYAQVHDTESWADPRFQRQITEYMIEFIVWAVLSKEGAFDFNNLYCRVEPSDWGPGMCRVGFTYHSPGKAR